jgi:cytochrome c556
MNAASREYFEFIRKQTERSMDRMNELLRCRTPHDVAAVQTDLVRETISSAPGYQPADGRCVTEGR